MVNFDQSSDVLMLMITCIFTLLCLTHLLVYFLLRTNKLLPLHTGLTIQKQKKSAMLLRMKSQEGQGKKSQ